MCVVSLTALVLACSRGGTHGTQPAASTSPAPLDSAGVASMQAADITSTVNRLAAALCDRIMECATTDQRLFSSRAVCLDQMRASLSHDLNSSTCPGSLDEGQVRTCMTAVESQDCRQPLESPEPIDQCTASALCSKH
jgi:hypothetical protein